MTESSILRAPIEALNHSSKSSQRDNDKEWKNLVNELQNLKQLANGGARTADVVARLTELEAKLSALRAKMSETKRTEETYLQMLLARAKHVDDVAAAEASTSTTTSASATPADTNATTTTSSTPVRSSDNAAAAADAQLLNRTIVDFMLRVGDVESAKKFASETNSTLLCDFELYERLHVATSALRARSCKEALKWCNENRPRLKKANIDIEFELRTQEFIEYARLGDRAKAMSYARLAFPPFVDTQLREIQHVMTCLAVEPTTTQPRYKALFAADRYEWLAHRFTAAVHAVCGTPPLAPLLAHVVAGLAALKSNACGIEGARVDACPTCATAFGALASAVPVALRQQSCIVCRISGAVMNEHNPPLVLPNGNVYSTLALRSLAQNDRVRDPRTGEVFPLSACKKAFVL